jgi:hypothetical protein
MFGKKQAVSGDIPSGSGISSSGVAMKCDVCGWNAKTNLPNHLRRISLLILTTRPTQA